MSMIWIILIDIVVAVLGIIATSGRWLIIRHFRFVVPFSNYLEEKGVFDSATKKTIACS